MKTNGSNVGDHRQGPTAGGAGASPTASRLLHARWVRALELAARKLLSAALEERWAKLDEGRVDTVFKWGTRCCCGPRSCSTPRNCLKYGEWGKEWGWGVGGTRIPPSNEPPPAPPADN